MQGKSVVYPPNHKPHHKITSLNLQPHLVQNMQMHLLQDTLRQILSLLSLDQRLVFTKVQAPEVATILQARGRQQVRTGNFYNFKSISAGESCEGTATDDYSRRQGSVGQVDKVHSLCESLVFVSDGRQYLDSICFEHSLLQNPQKLVDLLTCNLHDPTALPMLLALKSNLKPQTFASYLQKCNSRDELQNNLVTFLRQQVLLHLRQEVMEGEVYVGQLQEERRVKKEFNNFWRYLPEQQKKRLLLLDCKDISGLLYHLGPQEKLTEDQLEQEIKILLKLNKNEFYNRIFRCKMKNIEHELVQYHRRVYTLWRKEVENIRRKKVPKSSREQRDYNSQRKGDIKREEAKRKGRMRKTISLESNETNETDGQLRDKSSKSPEKPMRKYEEEIKPEPYHHMLQRSQDERKQKREMICSVQRQERSIRSSKIKQKHEKPKCFKQKQLEYQKNPEEQKEIELSKRESVSSKTTFSSKKSQTMLSPLKEPRIKYSKIDIHNSTFKKLAQQLFEMSDVISEEANQYFQRRIVAFERIQFLLQLYAIPIKLFGSCANGIAVKNSDIDIAIDKSILAWMELIPDSQKVRVSLEKLQEIFSSHQCITQIKLIKTAAVPVMKLTIDTSLTFISHQFHSLNRPHNCGPIQADITIQTPSLQNQFSSHLGILTTCAISQWLAHIKPLHTIVIIMKEFFTLNRLNLSYEGGLNTISMIVMLVAYILDSGLQNQQNSALVLEKILTFYVKEFDEKKFGIDLLRTKGIFYKKEQYEIDCPKLMKADLQIRDPICQGKNMTRNSYLYPQIKAMFRKILDSCFNRSHRQMDELVQKTDHNDLMALSDKTFENRNVFLELHKTMEGNI